MKTKQTIAGWLTLLALATFNLQHSTAFGGLMFPIVTNDTAATGFGVACAGTNYLVGIEGDITANDEYQITAQLFDPTGTPVGARISPVPGHTGGNPFVASSGTNFLMVWPDDYLNGNHSSVNGQIITPSGVLSGGWFAITANAEQHFNSIESVAYGGGKYLVVWNDYSNGTNVYGQLVAANGTLIGGNFLICPLVIGQYSKGAAVASDGTNFLVVWQYSNSGANQDTNVTYGVFVSPAGTVGTPFVIGQTWSAAPNTLYAIFNGTNYLVAYNSSTNPNDGAKPVYGRFVTPAGTFPGNEFVIVTNGNARVPALAFDGNNYLLCWNNNLGATNSAVQCQFLNAGGQPMGPQFTPFLAQSNEAPLAAIPIYDGKRFVLIATLSADGFDPTNDAGIYGAFIPASTTPPQFCAGTCYSNKQCALTLAGTPGINYAIEMATNLVAASWTSIVTNSPTNGPFTFTDPCATNSSRFYRAVKQ